MPSFHDFSDGVGSLTTQAVHASACRFSFLGGFTAKGNRASVSLHGLIGDPPSFSTCGCNPCGGYAMFVLNLKRPFCAQINNVLVANRYRGKRINDHQSLFLEANLRPDPKCIGAPGEHETHQNLKKDYHPIGLRCDAVQCKQGQQKPSHEGPSEVSPGSKNTNHLPIISGAIK